MRETDIISFVQYDPASGEIESQGTMTVAMMKHQAEFLDQWFIRGEGTTDDNYVDMSGDTPAIKPKEELNVTFKGNQLSNLPQPCLVTVDDGPVHRVDDGVVELDLDPGKHTVRIRSVRYRPKTIEIDL